jgi:hypothetical protein
VEEQNQEESFFEEEISETEVRVPKNFSFRYPIKMVCVAQRLGTVQERRQEQSCLFLGANYRNKGHHSDKHLVSIPGEDTFCSSETKHVTRTALRIKQLFGEEIT